MAFVTGMTVALGVAAFARLAGLDRDRAFYPTVLIVTASYYVLFAVLGGDDHALMLEAIVLAAFASAAVLGLHRDHALVTAGLALHGVFDVIHGHAIANPGVPDWWPAFCLGFDVAAAGYLIATRWHVSIARSIKRANA